MSAVYYYLYLLDVGLPGSVGLTVRVGYLQPKDNTFAAYFAFCHCGTPPFFYRFSRQDKSVLRLVKISISYYNTFLFKMQYVFAKKINFFLFLCYERKIYFLFPQKGGEYWFYA